MPLATAEVWEVPLLARVLTPQSRLWATPRRLSARQDRWQIAPTAQVAESPKYLDPRDRNHRRARRRFPLGPVAPAGGKGYVSSRHSQPTARASAVIARRKSEPASSAPSATRPRRPMRRRGPSLAPATTEPRLIERRWTFPIAFFLVAEIVRLRTNPVEVSMLKPRDFSYGGPTGGFRFPLASFSFLSGCLDRHGQPNDSRLVACV